MKSRTVGDFRKLFSRLPVSVQRQAREAYRKFAADPSHPGLEFKRIHVGEAVWSARVSRKYRVLGKLDGDTMLWFWIGTHAEYDQIIDKL